MAYIMDFFAADTLNKVIAAIEAKKVQYPAYVFIRSEDGSDTGRLAFVDQNNVLKFIVGEENRNQVVRVDELPSVESGDEETLYICGDIVYSFNGKEYVAAYKDHSKELEELSDKITAIEEMILTLQSKDTELEEKTTLLETLQDKIEALEESVSQIEESVVTFVELE